MPPCLQACRGLQRSTFPTTCAPSGQIPNMTNGFYNFIFTSYLRQLEQQSIAPASQTRWRRWQFCSLCNRSSSASFSSELQLPNLQKSMMTMPAPKAVVRSDELVLRTAFSVMYDNYYNYHHHCSLDDTRRQLQNFHKMPILPFLGICHCKMRG